MSGEYSWKARCTRLLRPRRCRPCPRKRARRGRSLSAHEVHGFAPPARGRGRFRLDVVFCRVPRHRDNALTPISLHHSARSRIGTRDGAPQPVPDCRPQPGCVATSSCLRQVFGRVRIGVFAQGPQPRGEWRWPQVATRDPMPRHAQLTGRHVHAADANQCTGPSISLISGRPQSTTAAIASAAAVGRGLSPICASIQTLGIRQEFSISCRAGRVPLLEADGGAVLSQPVGVVSLMSACVWRDEDRRQSRGRDFTRTDAPARRCQGRRPPSVREGRSR